MENCIDKLDEDFETQCANLPYVNAKHGNYQLFKTPLKDKTSINFSELPSIRSRR